MKVLLFLLPLIPAVLLPFRGLAAPADTPANGDIPSWKNADGRTIRARFVRLEGDAVVIVKEEGGEFTVPFFKLSADSVSQAKSLGGAPPSPGSDSGADVPEPTPKAGKAPVDAWHLDHSPAEFEKLPEAQARLERESLDPGLLSAAIAHATNKARAERGAPSLRYSPALRACAFGHSRDMVTLGFFSHENPQNPARRSMTRRMAEAGVTTTACAENISSLGAEGHTYLSYARAVVEQWMKSPGHRENLLSRKYRFLGCGAHACRCPRFHLLATQNFAAEAPVTTVPAAAAPAPAPSGPAVLAGRTATVPAGVPPAVRLAIEAGNTLQTKGYKYGGGRDQLEDTGYDCSGSVSYVLIKAGLLKEPLTSAALTGFGEPGPGRWITISARPGHAFITLCGLRLDTGGRGGIGPSGPRWSLWPRGGGGWTLRHPPGL